MNTNPYDIKIKNVGAEMPMRDHFASLVLQGHVFDQTIDFADRFECDVVAAKCYQMADAMMAKRITEAK